MKGIAEEGITRGSVPFVDSSGLRLIPNYQWLTINKDFEQPWGDIRYSTLPYDRTEFRIEIKVPKLREKNLIKWSEAKLNKKNQMADTLNSFGDSENWYLYKGVIFPQWITEIIHKSEIENPSEEGLRA